MESLEELCEVLKLWASSENTHLMEGTARVEYAPSDASRLTARALLLVFAFALLIRLIALACAFHFGGGEAFMSPDSGEFLNRALLRPGLTAILGFDPDQSYDKGLMPLAAWLMSITAGLPEGTPALGYIVLQCIMDAMTCVVIAAAADTIRRGWGLWAGMLAAANATQVSIALLYLADSIFLFFASVALFAGLRLIRQPGWGTALGLGAALGLAGLTRSAIVPLAPCFLVLLFWLMDKQTLWPRRLAHLIAATCIFAVVLSPAVIRNVADNGTIAITNQGGVHLLYWVVPLVRNFAEGTPVNVTQTSARNELNRRLAQPDTSPDAERTAKQLGWEMLWEKGLLPVFQAWSAGAMLNLTIPAAADAPILRSLQHESFYETPGENIVDKIHAFLTEPKNTAFVTVMSISAAGVAIFLAALIFGTVVASRVHALMTLFLLAWVAGFLALNGPIAAPKYRLPIEPVWMILAAAALCVSISWIRQRLELAGR